MQAYRSTDGGTRHVQKGTACMHTCIQTSVFMCTSYVSGIAPLRRSKS